MTTILITVTYPRNELDFSDGYDRFIDILKTLSRVRGVSGKWVFGPHDIFEDYEIAKRSLEEIEKSGSEQYDFYSAVTDNTKKFKDWDGLIEVHYFWGNTPNRIIIKIKEISELTSLTFQDVLNFIEAILSWRVPLHISAGSMIYLMHHHPLSKRRLGIRWIGWLPNQIRPEDVPEAEVAQPLHEGTLIASQKEFWHPIPDLPGYSSDAIQRTQDVEIRLATLGALPEYGDILQMREEE